MASVLLRNVEPALHARLKARAAAHHRSLEEEVKELLRQAVVQPDPPLRENLADLAKRFFGPGSGVDLELPSRSAPLDRPPIEFSGPEFDPPSGS
jgi:antitoxin FitA